MPAGEQTLKIIVFKVAASDKFSIHVDFPVVGCTAQRDKVVILQSQTVPAFSHKFYKYGGKSGQQHQIEPGFFLLMLRLVLLVVVNDRFHHIVPDVLFYFIRQHTGLLSKNGMIKVQISTWPRKFYFKNNVVNERRE